MRSCFGNHFEDHVDICGIMRSKNLGICVPFTTSRTQIGIINRGHISKARDVTGEYYFVDLLKADLTNLEKNWYPNHNIEISEKCMFW